MCGLAGIWHPDRRAVDDAALRRMTRALIHRGPDEEGYYQVAGVGLGHRRLSIIDLSTGQQPLSNEDGSIWVVFNGEIFNYVELRANLTKRGHTFKTHSDTETIVHLYEERGLDFVEDLNGQFSIALWDGNRRRLVLARDRVGIRPLFHATLRDGTVLFGSEMKALLAHGALRAEIDPVALGQITSLWVCVPPRTGLKGIDELPPGRMLVLEPGKRTERQYWRYSYPREHEYEEKSLEHWVREVRELLHDAVRLQLRSDVPVVTYLSGGLDSSILTALVKQHHINDLMTFSVGFEDARFDERSFQNEMAQHLQTDHRHLEVAATDIGEAFTEVVWFAERPMTRTAPAPLLELAGLVHESGIKVVLTGEGADELFAGYNIFKEDKVRRFWARSPESRWRGRLLSRLYGYIDRDPKAEAFWQLFFKKGMQDVGDPFYSHRVRWSNMEPVKRLFAADCRAQMQSEDELLAELDAYLEPERSRWHPLCRAQHLEMSLFMSGYLLSSQGDRMSMGRSVEGRVPFLDHRLVDLAARIPPHYKLRGLNEKYVLKQAFADVLPAAITERPKQPYRAPIAASLLADRETLVASLLETRELERTGLVDGVAVQKLLAKTAAGAASERDEMGIAIAASVQLLHHLFVDKFSSAISSTSAGLACK
jgi:asparagine synthase (glutamine-hydrolysing)